MESIINYQVESLLINVLWGLLNSNQMKHYYKIYLQMTTPKTGHPSPNLQYRTTRI